MKKVEKLINFSSRNENSKNVLTYGSSLIESQLDKTFKKNSKIISVSSALDQNVKVKAALFLFMALPVTVLKYSGWLELGPQTFMIVILAILSFIVIVPSRIQKSVTQRRFSRISNDIPYLIDLLAVCIQSGMTVEAALTYIAYMLGVSRETVSRAMKTLKELDLIKLENKCLYVREESLRIYYRE